MPITTNRSYAEFFANAFPWTIEVAWFGQEGVHVLDDDRRAVFQAGRTENVGGQSDAIRVQVVSKTAGPIVDMTFGYDEALTGRADNRTADYPIGGNRCFMVIEHCGFDWYIAEPANPEQLSGQVEAWLDLWR